MIKKIVSSPQSHWTKAGGEAQEIVISSRIRLARNLDKFTMPPYQDESSGHAILERSAKAAAVLQLSEENKLYFYRLHELPPLERQILLEKHLISPEHADDLSYRGILISSDEAVSIMINEEDHLRIQALYPGLQLEEAWETADRIDNLLEEQLDYAFDEQKGYLTACPTNVGTGLRASVMVHLPALILTRQATKVFKALSQLGLAVRGLYGEGTDATGHIFQISNQITLGQKEQDIIQNLTTVTRQIIGQEEETRKILMQESPLQIADRVGRAYGILRNAALLNSQESLNYLSDVRLGMDLGLLQAGLTGSRLTELLILAQPGFLQKISEKVMESPERDAVRAKLFREKLAT